MNKFIWSEFGVLDRWSVDAHGNLFIFNAMNESRKMSHKYKETITRMIEKSEVLKGRDIQIRTSQNTSAYLTSEWFSDFSLAGTEVQSQLVESTDIESIAMLEKKLEKRDAELKETKAEVERIQSRLVKVSDKAENYQAKATEAQAEAAEAAELANQLQETYDKSTGPEKFSEDQMVQELHAMGLEGKDWDVMCVGHPDKTLALRLGINRKKMGTGRIKISVHKLIKHNIYEVSFQKLDDRKVRMAFGYKDSNLHVRTFFSDISNFTNLLLDICGVHETEIKQQSDTYDLEKLIEMYRKVKESISN